MTRPCSSRSAWAPAMIQRRSRWYSGSEPLEPFAALMRNLCGCLEKQQARVAVLQVEPPSARFADHLLVVRAGSTPKRDSRKPFLPSHGSMAQNRRCSPTG